MNINLFVYIRILLWLAAFLQLRWDHRRVSIAQFDHNWLSMTIKLHNYFILGVKSPSPHTYTSIILHALYHAMQFQSSYRSCTIFPPFIAWEDTYMSHDILIVVCSANQCACDLPLAMQARPHFLVMSKAKQFLLSSVSLPCCLPCTLNEILCYS